MNVEIEALWNQACLLFDTTSHIPWLISKIGMAHKYKKSSLSDNNQSASLTHF
jgi:hypothetical protein